MLTWWVKKFYPPYSLLTPEKAQTIREAITQIEYTGALSPIKEHLGDGFTYGEIRAVLGGDGLAGALKLDLCGYAVLAAIDTQESPHSHPQKDIINA